MRLKVCAGLTLKTDLAFTPGVLGGIDGSTVVHKFRSKTKVWLFFLRDLVRLNGQMCKCVRVYYRGLGLLFFLQGLSEAVRTYLCLYEHLTRLSAHLTLDEVVKKPTLLKLRNLRIPYTANKDIPTPTPSLHAIVTTSQGLTPQHPRTNGANDRPGHTQ